jgi:hypothetical protein
MKNVTDFHNPLRILNAVEDAPVAYPNPQLTLLAPQLLAPRRPRIFSKFPQPCAHANLQLLVKPREITLRGRRQLDAIDHLRRQPLSAEELLGLDALTRLRERLLQKLGVARVLQLFEKL